MSKVIQIIDTVSKYHSLCTEVIDQDFKLKFSIIVT